MPAAAPPHCQAFRQDAAVNLNDRPAAPPCRSVKRRQQDINASLTPKLSPACYSICMSMLPLLSIHSMLDRSHCRCCCCYCCYFLLLLCYCCDVALPLLPSVQDRCRCCCCAAAAQTSPAQPHKSRNHTIIIPNPQRRRSSSLLRVSTL